MNKYLVFLFFALFIFVTGCEKKIEQTLVDTKWILSSYSYPDRAKMTTIRADLYYIEFHKYFGIVSGSIACNAFRSKYTVSEKKLSIAPTVMTMQRCGDQTARSFIELTFFEDYLYSINNNKLELISPDGKQLIFKGVLTKNRFGFWSLLLIKITDIFIDVFTPILEFVMSIV